MYLEHEEALLREEGQEAEAFLREFFQHYYIERDTDKVVAMAAEHIQCVGLAFHELALNREAFAKFVRRQMEQVSHPLEHHILGLHLSPAGPHMWVALAQVEIHVHTDDCTAAVFYMRLTATMGKRGERWQFASMHVSEVNEAEGESVSRSMKLLGNLGKRAEERCDLGDLLARLFPGGVVVNRIDRNFPVLQANQQYLGMLGFSSFEEYRKAVQGLYIRLLHPDDREIYQKHCKFALATGKRCECEYRLKQLGGRYIWVHDIGQRAMTEDGQEVLVEAVIDITEQISQRKKLENETLLDSLTGIYNRKGGQSGIKSGMAPGEPWVFCMSDLDNFKKVNDLYGHQKGDEILCYAARQLQKTFGARGVVCRLGGDEFTLFLPRCGDLDAVKAQILGLMEDYARLLQKLCPEAGSSMSFGGIYGRGERDLDALYRLADQKLYEVKNSGKGRLLLCPCPEDESL